MTNDAISPIIHERFPDFIRGEYPKFAQYLYDYFKFLEQDDNFLQIVADWRSNTEPSNNIDGYIDSILRDAGFVFQREITIPKSTMLHFLREFYLARGSVQSFRFLFQVMFGVESRIQHPRDRMLWLDMAEYGERHFVFLRSTNAGTKAYEEMLLNVGQEGGTLTGSITGLVAAIEAIRPVQYNDGEYLEVEILRPLGEFIPDDLITIRVGANTFNEQLIPIMTLEVDDPGTGYSVGDTITVNGVMIPGMAEVDSIQKGSIDSVIVVNGGEGYAVGDIITADSSSGGFGFSAKVTALRQGASSRDLTTTIDEVQVLHGGYNYEKIPVLHTDPRKTPPILTAVSASIGRIQSVVNSIPFIGYDLDRPEDLVIRVDSETGSGASFKIIPATRFSRSAWTDEKGFLGINSTLIDSDKYQQFSYEIISSVTPSRYLDMVTDLLHPVGYVRTSIVDIVGEVQSTIDVSGSGVFTNISLTYPISYTEIEPQFFSITILEYGNAIAGSDGVNTFIITDNNGHIIVWS